MEFYKYLVHRLQPCSVKRRDDPGPEPTRNPLGHLGLSRDTFSLFLHMLQS